MPRSPGRYVWRGRISDFSAVIRPPRVAINPMHSVHYARFPTHPPLGKQSETRTCFCLDLYKALQASSFPDGDFWPNCVDSAPSVLPDTLTNRPSRVKYTHIQMYRASQFPSRIQSCARINRAMFLDSGERAVEKPGSGPVLRCARRLRRFQRRFT